MFFLIDGYNLMHAVGFVGRTPANSLAASRRRLLDWLAAAALRRTDRLRVVFDGLAAPADSGEAVHRGVQVRFAYRATADDAIEAELAALPRGTAVVVSDDGRLHESARRRGCEAWGCGRFVDWLIEPKQGTVAFAVEEEKPRAVGGEDELLRAFTEPNVRSRR